MLQSHQNYMQEICLGTYYYYYMPRYLLCLGTYYYVPNVSKRFYT